MLAVNYIKQHLLGLDCIPLQKVIIRNDFTYTVLIHMPSMDFLLCVSYKHYFHPIIDNCDWACKNRACEHINFVYFSNFNDT